MKQYSLTQFHYLLRVLLLSIAHSIFAQSVPSHGLIAYYPIRGNVQDDSGFARHGIVFGAVPGTNRLGYPSQAMTFRGNGDYFAASSTINDVTNSFTISLWFSTTGIHGEDRYAPFLIYPSHGQTTWNDASAGIGISAGQNMIKVWEHTHDYNPRVITMVGNYSGWTHVAVVYSNREPSLYINGSLRAKGTKSPRVVRPSNGQTLSARNQYGGFGGGAQVGGDGQWFAGSLDEIRIYNRVLSSDEIMALYQDGEALLSIRTAVEIEFATQAGKTYQLQARDTTQAGLWTNLGSPFLGTGQTMQVLRSTKVIQAELYRVVEIQ